MEHDDEEELDKIFIKNLRLRCIIGINESERREKQDVVINVVIWSDARRAAKTDDIEKTVDYKEINKNIIKLVENSEFFLVETLAERIAHNCLQHERIGKVRVTVEKPGALRFAESVGAEMIRKKDKHRAMTVAYLSLGSNIEPEKNILEAVRLLSEHVKIAKASMVYLTEPLLRRSQPEYYNCVLKIETDILTN